jgi:hypothetical protein
VAPRVERSRDSHTGAKPALGTSCISLNTLVTSAMEWRLESRGAETLAGDKPALVSSCISFSTLVTSAWPLSRAAFLEP